MVKISILKGDNNIAVITPTPDINRDLIKKFLNSINLNDPKPTVILIESSGKEFVFSKSMNIGINEAFKLNPQYLLLSNDDVFFDQKNWLYTLIDGFIDENVGYVVPNLKSKEGNLNPMLIKMPNYFLARIFVLINPYLSNKTRYIISNLVKNLYGKKIKQINFIIKPQKSLLLDIQPISLIKTDILKKVGFFDENFINGVEDFDLSLRFILKGYKGILVWNVVGFHIGSSTGGEGWANALHGNPKNILRTNENWKIFLNKHKFTYKEAMYLCEKNIEIVDLTKA